MMIVKLKILWLAASLSFLGLLAVSRCNLRLLSDQLLLYDVRTKMIRKESLHDKVVRHLALQILKGDVTTLPNEADLGKDLRVSRSILRESIKVLAAKGLLEVGPKTGTRVRPRKDRSHDSP